eukprot:1687349-Amphidinium_carterae.1
MEKLRQVYPNFRVAFNFRYSVEDCDVLGMNKNLGYSLCSSAGVSWDFCTNLLTIASLLESRLLGAVFMTFRPLSSTPDERTLNSLERGCAQVWGGVEVMGTS